MSSTEPLDTDHHDASENAHESWDAFWAEVERAERAERKGPQTQVIRGVEVVVPHDLPLLFERTLDQLKGSEDFKELLAALFGADVLDAWVKAGMKDREFEVVFAWGYANGKGKPTTFAEAYELHKARESTGKDETGSARTSGASANSGQSSKQTSSGSTGSRQRTSHT